MTTTNRRLRLTQPEEMPAPVVDNLSATVLGDTAVHLHALASLITHAHPRRPEPMPTTPTVSPTAPAAFITRCTAADVKADQRSPEGPGLDTGEDQRTLTKAGTTPTTDTDHRHNAADRRVGWCDPASMWATRPEPRWTERRGDLIAVIAEAVIRAPGGRGVRHSRRPAADRGERRSRPLPPVLRPPSLTRRACCGIRTTSSRLITGSLRRTIAGPISL
jgi:hypothetical protein